MLYLLLILTATVIGSAMWIAYFNGRDALMPMVVFGPMLLYVYVYSPAMLLYNGTLERAFRDEEGLEHVAVINLVGVGLFCIALVTGSKGVGKMGQSRNVLGQLGLDELTRSKLFKLASIFGVMAFAGFAYMVHLGGGFVEVFSRPKTFLSGGSGYIGELPMLAYSAIALLAITLRGKQIGLRHIALAFFFASPHLIMASLGGRRGPAFLIICTLVVSWYVAKGRRPSLTTAVSMVVLLGAVMLFIGSNRRNLYLGSEQGISGEAFRERLALSGTNSGQEFVYSTGLILTAESTEQFFWGKRYFALLFVRPIPKQLWPSKYEDLGLRWMVTAPGTAGLSEMDWRRAVGFVPLLGSAGGFVADMFVEFWWFGLFAGYLIGRVYGYCWRRSVVSGQLWTVIYMELLALSVYLPAQSVGAWLHRALLLTVPTWILWVKFVQPYHQSVPAFRHYSAFRSRAVRP